MLPSNALSSIDVFVSGKFNVLHPGHIRLFKFARSFGERLTVAVESDRVAGTGAHLNESLRLEGVINSTLVDNAFIFDEPIADLILRLKPRIIVKGKEHEGLYCPEADAIKSYGGSLIFSSGEIQFKSTDLLNRELAQQSRERIVVPQNFLSNHLISPKKLVSHVEGFSRLRVLTVGDIIVDEYINCEPLGMSREDVSIAVTPIDRNRFIGGAAIVAAHAASLGAESRFISVSGKDRHRDFILNLLAGYKVNSIVLEDSSRPTTVKERFRSGGRTLLRVNHLHQSSISGGLQQRIYDEIKKNINSLDLLIFSDFNYGVLTQSLVDEISKLARENGVLLSADSQSSSQVGDIGRFKDVDLLTPTEHEARVSIQNREDGLVVLAEKLRQKSGAKFILLKMGEDGVLIHAPNKPNNEWLTDRIEALNNSPKDVAGAGDSMLVASSLTLALGGSIWESACLGSIAAALQVGRVGNIPLKSSELLGIIR
jgi:rfaE bifunctional protein kinase chain/domain